MPAWGSIRPRRGLRCPLITIPFSQPTGADLAYGILELARRSTRDSGDPRQHERPGFRRCGAKIGEKFVCLPHRLGASRKLSYFDAIAVRLDQLDLVELKPFPDPVSPIRRQPSLPPC